MNIVVNCGVRSQVAYDTVKHSLLHMGMPDDIRLHFASGLSAGFAATVLGSPWDVIGTRLMARTSAKGSQPYISYRILRTYAPILASGHDLSSC